MLFANPPIDDITKKKYRLQQKSKKSNSDKTQISNMTNLKYINYERKIEQKTQIATKLEKNEVATKLKL